MKKVFAIMTLFVCAIAANAEPKVIGKWTGSGMKDTESFTPASRECVIAWTMKTTNVAGLLQIYVHDAENDRLVALTANTMEDGTDSSVVRFSPGKKYYLKIVSANARWAVTVTN